MWGTTPDQDNNNVAQPAPNYPGQADTPLHGEFAPDRRMVRDADLCPRLSCRQRRAAATTADGGSRSTPL